MGGSRAKSSDGARQYYADEGETAALISELRSHSQTDREIFESLQLELRHIARAKMRFERPDHTLQPTALVNEAFIKLFNATLSTDFWRDKSRALWLIAHAMEQILIDHAAAHRALKRGGAQKQRVPIDEQQARELSGEPTVRLDSELFVKPAQSDTVLAVRDLLQLLCAKFPRQARVLQLQFYGGLTQEETAVLLGVSLETVELDTRKAKAFFKVHIGTAGQ